MRVESGRFSGPSAWLEKLMGHPDEGGKLAGPPSHPTSSGMPCLFMALWITVSLGKSLLPGLGKLAGCLQRKGSSLQLELLGTSGWQREMF